MCHFLRTPAASTSANPLAVPGGRVVGQIPFWGGSAPRTLAAEIERELVSSQIFRAINPPDDRSALVLETEIRALCAQAIGFLFIRVAGITSLHFTLRDGDVVLLDRTIAKVVTDADPEYTGPSAAFIEQAMKILISDSLRGVLRELLAELDQLEPAAQQGSAF